MLLELSYDPVSRIIPIISKKSKFSLIPSSRSTMLSLLIVGLMLTTEFASLEEPTEVFEVAIAAGSLDNGPKGIGSRRQRVPRDPLKKLRLLIVRSNSIKFAEDQD
jgi:hypothetical protein